MTESNEGGVRVERTVRLLEQYLRKASFGSGADRFSALECLDEIAKVASIVCSARGRSLVNETPGVRWLIELPMTDDEFTLFNSLTRPNA